MLVRVVFFCKQKTSYELRISDWSADVCSSDLAPPPRLPFRILPLGGGVGERAGAAFHRNAASSSPSSPATARPSSTERQNVASTPTIRPVLTKADRKAFVDRSEEHTSELQSLMRISYAVFCLKKKTKPPLKTSIH